MQNASITQRQMALVAGWSLIMMALVAGFSYGYAFPKTGLVQNGEPVGAIDLHWLRYGVAGFVLVLLLDILVAWSLYCFLRPAGWQLSLLSSWLRLLYGGLLGSALYYLLFAFHPDAINAQEVAGMLHLHFALFEEMWSLALIIFGCHLAALGWLLIRSGYVPKVYGVLALIAALCYAGTSFMQLLWPGYKNYGPATEGWLAVPMAAGELALAFWLVFRGGRKKYS